MPRPTSPLPHPLRDRPFTYREAVDGGVNRRRLAHGDVTHPHRGVYVAAVPEQGYERCLAAVPLLGDRRWFSHVTAARLWGIPAAVRRGGR